jgi:general secretion pathway protein D
VGVNPPAADWLVAMRLLAVPFGIAMLSIARPCEADPAPPPMPPGLSWFPPVAGSSVPSSAVADSSGQGLVAGVGETFEVVPLKYADVSEIVGLLTGNQSVRPNDNFVPQEPNFGSSGLGGFYGGELPGGGSPFVSLSAPAGNSGEALGQTINTSIGIDRRLNAVVLRGPPTSVEAIKAEIAKLDVPVTSVVLETEFVELTETGARNLGLDFNNSNGQIANGTYVFSRGFPGVTDTPKGGGVTATFQAALYAQIARGEGNVVSKPRISAQSGGEAKIVTGDALPILTSIAVSGVNAVQQQVQYVNVGVTLQIAPRVGDDGFVTSHVFAVVSTVTGYSQGYPTISQREASTSATVRDGQTFVIGGLTQESKLSNHSKLPLLGDVPLLGKVFTVEHTSRTKTELYIVVTPHIVHTTHENQDVHPQAERKGEN